MAKNKAERKKEAIRIGALVVAGIMILTVLIAVLVNK